MTSIIKDFTDLNTWQESHKLVLMIYKITKCFPKNELHSLTDQMCRAAVSITSNIAEWFGRQGYREKIQFYYLSHGSLTELKNQLIISRDVGYINNNEFQEISTQLVTAQKLLQGLIKSSKLYLNHNS